MWLRACRVLGLDDLLVDQRFTDNARRVAHRDELTREIEAVLTTRPTAHWLARLAEAGVPAAPGQDVPPGPARAQSRAPRPGAGPQRPGRHPHLEAADRHARDQPGHPPPGYHRGRGRHRR